MLSPPPSRIRPGVRNWEGAIPRTTAAIGMTTALSGSCAFVVRTRCLGALFSRCVDFRPGISCRLKRRRCDPVAHSREQLNPFLHGRMRWKYGMEPGFRKRVYEIQMNGALSSLEPLAASRTDLHQRERQALRIPCQQYSISVGQELPLARDGLPDQQRYYWCNPYGVQVVD